jgi:hypothetical protein
MRRVEAQRTARVRECEAMPDACRLAAPALIHQSCANALGSMEARHCAGEPSMERVET